MLDKSSRKLIEWGSMPRARRKGGEKVDDDGESRYDPRRMSFFQKLFGDPNAREVAKIRSVIEKEVGGLSAAMEALTDEQLKAKTSELREKIASGTKLDDLLVESFAVVREASRRTLSQRQYDVQLIGGVVLHRGMIAEMRTGEGKTLTATAPVYLNALTGKGVHVITVNDYLARRDAVWMGQVYYALGLRVACIQHAGSFIYDPDFKQESQHDDERDETGSFRVDMDYLRPVSRKEAYEADITYGTNNEFGFDYLRDNMAQRLVDRVQRPLHYAVIDEVDSILIDEARTPLIISAPAEEATDTYYKFAELVARLEKETDYKVDEKLRAATLTEEGTSKIEQWLGIENLYVQGGFRMVHHLEQALKAHALFRIDKDYVVKDGEVVIVDEFTGRMMQGRRYSEGLHQAIEAKERVAIQRESVTLATITFQNYFRLYEKISGMTGTAATEAEEFHKIYKLEVVSIPTHRDNKRVDLPDQVFTTELGKFKAVAREIKRRHELGQPVLVGTSSIEKNEVLHALLEQEGVPHQVLNAKNHEREAEIIAQAGRKGAVTVATNMAGRGVDILLGGNPPDKAMADEIRAMGGLCVMGTERHESRRIDNQLRGRAGRQGDPGTTQFFISVEDDLMRIFASDRMRQFMAMGVPEDEAIVHGLLNRSIESAQRKVEGHHFDIRKHLLEYDDVLNKHRQVFYGKRLAFLEAAEAPTTDGVRPTKHQIREYFASEMEAIVALHAQAEEKDAWEWDKIEEGWKALFPASANLAGLERIRTGEITDLIELRTAIVEEGMRIVDETYVTLEEMLRDPAIVQDLEKVVVLRLMDDLWIQHLEAMDHLRHGIGLQGYGQRDPLVEYKKEGYRLFHELLGELQRRVTRTLFHVQVNQPAPDQERHETTA